MKAMAILGSRAEEGQTAVAAKAFLDGIADAGGESQMAFLPEMDIARCRQCQDSGWGTCRAEGRCCIDDDFAGLVEKIRQADAVVFANPVYFSDLSESLRAFLDRLRRTCTHDAGKEGISGKPAVGICVAGGGGGGAPACLVSLEKIASRCGFDVVDLVPVRRQNTELKLQVLRLSGKWFADHAPAE